MYRKQLKGGCCFLVIGIDKYDYGVLHIKDIAYRETGYANVCQSEAQHKFARQSEANMRRHKCSLKESRCYLHRSPTKHSLTPSLNATSPERQH